MEVLVTTTDCPPLAVRITRSLLGYGVIAGPCYVVTAVAQACTRAGFDPTRHAVSQLVNGPFGWVQVVNFVLTGAMTVAAAVGVGRALRPDRLGRVATVLLAGYGFGLIAAGILRADPSDGFPPGTPPGPGAPSWHGIGHLLVGGIGFACLVGACFVIGAALARRGSVGLAWFSRLTAVVFAVAFGLLASGSGGPVAILAFTAAVVLTWAWLAASSVKLYRMVV
jgi:hypothetical protein